MSMVFESQTGLITESIFRAVIERLDEERESLALFWLANPDLAKQGAIEVQKLLSPDNAIWMEQYELSQHT
jgi:hypothetical protein